MFDSLSSRLSGILDKLTRRGALTEADVAEALREVRRALLEADVALDVVRSFTDKVRARAVGAEVMKSVTPGQMVVKIVHDVLVETLGADAEPISLNAVPPVPILMVGLQGSGKTTTTAKIAKRLSDRQGKRVLDGFARHPPPRRHGAARRARRPRRALPPCRSSQGRIASRSRSRRVAAARLGGYDVVMLDTAGRTTVDDELMNEAAEIKAATNPHETLLVADALTGQDAVNTARAFEGRLDLTGIVLTRIDGDGRGGAALSMRAVTGKPIKLMGVGEKIDALEDFHPARIANRILGMGDIVSLVEKAAETIDHEKAVAIAEKMRKGRFDLDDLREQLHADGEARRHGRHHGHDPRRRQDEGPDRQGRHRRPHGQAAGRHHRFDDAEGARQSRDPQGFAQDAASRRAPARRPSTSTAFEDAPPDGGHDEDDGPRQGRHDGQDGLDVRHRRGGGDPLAGLDLSALTPEQLETIKRELGGQLPPGFPGLGERRGSARRRGAEPGLPASFPGGLAGGKPSGLPGLGGAKLPGLGGLSGPSRRPQPVRG